VGTWDFVMDKSGAGAGFLRELGFPLPIYIPSCSPQSSSLSPEAGTIGQVWPPCLLSHSPNKKKKKKKKKHFHETLYSLAHGHQILEDPEVVPLKILANLEKIIR
jgi:hypothetical protein